MVTLSKLRTAGRLSKLLLVMVGAVMLLALAACGGEPVPTPTTTATSVPTATPTKAAQTPTATSAPVSTATPTPRRDIDSIPRTTSKSMTLTGAGATFPFPLYSKFSAEYNKLNPGIKINYQSIGSGGGINQVIQKTVDFGGTDGPMNAEQKTSAGSTVLHIPMAMGAVVPAYNLSGSPQIRFSQDTIASIYLGKITKWNDPKIAADNPGVTLPNQDIAVVYRSDGSGTTFIWTDYLANVSQEWKDKVGTATSVSWPTGLGAKGNEGVANQVGQIPGAVGYVELAYAKQNNLRFAQLKNKAGNWITPSLETTSAAAAGMIAAGEFPENMEARVVNAAGANSYGAAGFTWILIYQDLSVLPQMNLERAQELIRYALWSLDRVGGQQYHASLDYAPLDPLVVNMAKEKLKTVTFKGTPVWETMLP
ncbi:MAG: phosphate ABC transporter substrate-binding protein PstS [Dehalococcoidia bacterium]|nr:phosphate ABC transporter substrate-binding protein PstS [Dehalococcoidia bacterium]